MAAAPECGTRSRREFQGLEGQEKIGCDVADTDLTRGSPAIRIARGVEKTALARGWI